MNAKKRVNKAVRAMKDVDIPSDKVKPVLKDLLKVYKNWSHIEADNYRVLIDAIFESEEVPAAEQPKSSLDTKAAASELRLKVVNGENENEVEEEETEALVRTSKRLRRNREGQSSSLNRCSNRETQALLVVPRKEPVELPEALPHKLNGSQALVQSPDLNAINTVVKSQSVTCLSLGERQGKQPKQKSSMSALIENKDEPMTDDVAPLAIFRSGVSHGGDSSSRDGTIRGNHHYELSTQLASSRKTASANELENKKLVIVSDENLSDSASLAFGEVKISLSSNMSREKPTFQPPSFEAIIKSVEEKCLRSYKYLPLNFSVKNILKDICQKYLDLGSNSETEPRKGFDVSPAVDLMKRSSALNAMGLCFSSVNDSEISHSNIKSPFLILPSTPLYCDEVDNGCQLNKIMVRDKNDSDGDATNNLSLVLVPDTIRPVHHDDVAKGQENILIVLLNDIDASLPQSFYYMPQNVVFHDANVNFSLDRTGDNDCCFSCSGDCMSSDMHCACANRGGFAYTKDGFMKEDLLNDFISLNRDKNKDCRFFCEECPLEKVKSMDNTGSCKGHLVRKIVKECWVKCGCHKQCGNRVVQRGITRNLQVFMTPDGKGWGLRTLEDLSRGSFICEYVGEILTVAEFFKRKRQLYPVLLDAGWSGKGVQKEEDALCLDCTNYGNIARFINHRCHDSNMVEVPVAVETPDHHYYHVAFFTTRDVKAMEELNWDYGIDFDDKDNPIKAFQCLCGSSFCRNIKDF